MPMKAIKIIKSVIRHSLFLFFLYFLITLLIDSLLVFGRFQYYAIPTPSMEPTIRVGDLVVADHHVDLDELEVGEIILFETEIQNQSVIVIHYLYEINIVDGERIFTSIAENTTTPDDFVIRDQDIVGTYVFRVPYLGTFLRFIAHPIGKIVVVVDVIILYILYRLIFKSKPKEETL